MPPGPGPRIATEKLRAVLLWLMAFSGGFVFIEPGPYEFVGAATMFLFVVMGMTLRTSLAPLILLLTLLNVGYALSLFEVTGDMPATIWVLVSVFLALTAIFFAAMLGDNTEARLRWLMRGYIAAAVIVSLLAIAGYFGVGGGAFVRYGRATGTFKDPNVFAAFLVLPGLLILQRMLAGRRSEFLGGGVLLLVMMGGLFLSFSRAAWGQFVLCAILLMVLTFATSRSQSERLRIVVVAIVGVVRGGRVRRGAAVGRPGRQRCSRSARRCRRATTPAPPAGSAATSWRSRWRSTIRSAWGRCNSISRRPRTTSISTPSSSAAGSRARPISRSRW